jgi:predicted neuraminidase
MDWRIVKILDQQQDASDANRYQFSYPWMLRTSDGVFHLLYTWNRTRIKHIEFNQSWLDQAASSAAAAPAKEGQR